MFSFGVNWKLLVPGKFFALLNRGVKDLWTEKIYSAFKIMKWVPGILSLEKLNISSAFRICQLEVAD